MGKIGFHLLSGIVLGLSTLLACGLTFSKSWPSRISWLTLLALVFTAAALAHYYDRLPRRNDPFALGIITVVITAWILLAKYADFPAAIHDAIAKTIPTESHKRHTFTRWASRLGWTILTLFILIPTVGTLHFMATPPSIPIVAMPEPNEYNTLVRIGMELQKINIPDLDIRGSATKQSLTSFERNAASLLEQAREALRQDYQVPVVFDETYSKAHSMTNYSINQLANGFVAQGAAAQMKGNTIKATECYLEVVRMGKAIDHGRIMPWIPPFGDFEFTGIYNLHKLHTSLSNEQLMKLSTTLLALQEPDEPLDSIIAREEIACHYILGWEGRLHLMLYKATGYDPFFLTKNHFKQRLAYYRVLLIAIALRQYVKKHHEYPEKLDDLVPEFLDKLPDEPYGADGFVYRKVVPSPSQRGFLLNYELYSPGANRRDDNAPDQFSPTDDDIGF